MDCLFSRNVPKIKILDLTPPGDDFDNLKPQGAITFSIDRKYNVPLINIRFDGHTFDQSIVKREHFFLLEGTPLQTHSTTSSSDSSFDMAFLVKKRIAQNNLPDALRHPRERLPTTTPQILESNLKVDFQHSTFFISNEEIELRINAICFQFWKIQLFTKFVCDNHHKIKERHYVYADLYIFAEFLFMFLTKEFVDPKGMFRKIFRHHPFEFSMFDLSRE